MALAQARVIRGAVATLGVSERVAFLRRTYAHLGVALIAFIALTAAFMQTETSASVSYSVLTTRGGFLMVLILFMVIGAVAQRMALAQTSSAVQYLGLAIGVIGEAAVLQPLLWRLVWTSRASADIEQLILTSALVTIAIFVGLTLTVFISKKDFSFLRGILTMATFAALGLIIASLIFGFALGTVFMGAMVMLLGGYILYQTSIMMSQFPPTAHVGAALMLFSTIATVFWYVLQLFADRR